MTGDELRKWRKNNHYRQADLQDELELGSRATLSAWENAAEPLPRLVELALIALEKVPETRRITGATKSASVKRRLARGEVISRSN